MKRSASLFLALLIVASLLTGCNGDSTIKNEKDVALTAEPDGSSIADVGGIAMITNGGTIDDHSFNAMLWKGLARAGSDFGFEPAFIEETGETDEQLLGGITDLYNTGSRLIFCPGFSLITAAGVAGEKYGDLKLVMIDAILESMPNVVSTNFAIEQAGFIAGVAAAVEMNSAEFGFIGGAEFPGIQFYNWGFQQGLMYANEKHGTTAIIKEENVIYEGSFGNFDGGKSIAADMYDRGVSVILIAAGYTGMGALEEAKERAASEKVWIVSVDFDQYERGIYDGTNSVILTSAVKKYDSAAYEISQLFLNDKFPGGKVVEMDLSNNGVGIPENNPNLSEAAEQAAAEAIKSIKEGLLGVINYPDGLIP